MNRQSVKALLALVLAVAGAVSALPARADDTNPDYVFPGIGTLVIRWLLG